MITTLDKNTALVLIDLQKGIAKGELAHPVSTILKNAALLIAGFRSAGLPIVLVTVNPTGANWLKARVERPGVLQQLPPDFTELATGIEARPDDIFITKKTWGAFHHTGLEEALQQRGVTGIVIGGISTSAGVESTARAASECGFNISFATDAMTDRIADAHESSLRNIFPRIGELGTTEVILEKLRSK